MKKNFKFTSIVAAALFAASPVVSLVAAPNTIQAAAVVTKSSVVTHYLRDRSVYTNSTRISASTSINNIHLTNNTGTEIETNDAVLNNGKYTLNAQVTIMGLTPTSTDRSVTIVNNNGEIIGSASVNAHSTLAQGNLEFDFAVKNGQLSHTSLGNITGNTIKVSKKKVTKKKHNKVAHKKNHKKAHKKTVKHTKKRKYFKTRQLPRFSFALKK